MGAYKGKYVALYDQPCINRLQRIRQSGVTLDTSMVWVFKHPDQETD